MNWNVRWACLVVASVHCLGCSSSANESNETTPALSSPIVFPTEFVRIVDDSERIAAGLQKSTTRAVCGLVQSGSLDKWRAAVSAKVAARHPRRLDEVAATGSTVATLASGAAVAGYDELVSWLTDGLAEYAIVDRCKLKPKEVYVAQDETRVWGKFDVGLAGKTKAGFRLEYHGEISLRFSGVEPNWVIDKVEITRLEKSRYAGTRFVDVSHLTGVGLHRSKEKQDAIVGKADSLFDILWWGGLTVLDWNHDGAPDLLTTQKASLFSVFVNDKRGGFTRVEQSKLIRHAQAASFYIFVDLDNDGSEELVGTRRTSCENGRAHMPIYKVTNGRMINAGRDLTYAQDCDKLAEARHIAADDMNGDGRLDLFFSFFSGSGLPRNSVDSLNGGRNRLFLNHGDLLFVDATDDVGIDEETRNTYVAHWLDYDDDGYRDLLVLNDFGPNKLYRNLGDGTLTKTSSSALTDRGFSMGVSVSDFDNDLDLDVYVSNMFSYAGNRILSITDELSDEQKTMLFSMARGNTLYEKQTGGEYVEVSAQHGLNNAQWAWGSAFFDYDNDGDRDLHVVNGHHSNPGGKGAPDF